MLTSLNIFIYILFMNHIKVEIVIQLHRSDNVDQLLLCVYVYVSLPASTYKNFRTGIDKQSEDSQH